MKEAIIWIAIYLGMIVAALTLAIVLYGIFTEEG